MIRVNVTPQTAEQINQYASNTRDEPDIIRLNDGGWIIVWKSIGQDGSSGGIYGRRYAADGTAIGNEFRINNATEGSQTAPAVAALQDGGYVVAWTGPYAAGADIMFRRYGTDGPVLTYDTVANFKLAGDQIDPDVTGLAGGGFVVTWTEKGTLNNTVYARLYNRDGVEQLRDIRVSTTTSTLIGVSSAVALSDGGYVIAWEDRSGFTAIIHLQRFDASGAAIGETISHIATADSSFRLSPQITAFGDGSYAVVWMSANSNGNDIYAQRYDEQGHAVGSQVKVNTTTANHRHPVIAATVDGGYVVVWSDSSGDAVMGQRYNAAGDKAGSAFTIAGIETVWMTVTGLDNGGFVVAWVGTDGGNTPNIVQRVYNGDLSVVAGDENDNVFDGTGLNVHFKGGDGNDTYVVDSENVVISEFANHGRDEVLSSVSWTMESSIETLVMTGRRHISGWGNFLDNSITGNQGNNVLDGGTGADMLTGGAGNDTYYVDNVGDNVVEAHNKGDDIIYSSVTYTLENRFVESLVLTGSDDVNGRANSLDNTLIGNDGDNRLAGLKGDDSLTGGLGADIFAFGRGSGADTILDFDASEGDAIDLKAYSQGVAFGGRITITDDGFGNALIDMGDGNAVRVTGTTHTDPDFLAAIIW